MSAKSTSETLSPVPWYKEPWPWLLISVPALTVVAGGITLWYALNTNDGVVADDYYKQGLAVNQVINRDVVAREMGLQAEIMRSGQAIRVFLTSSSARALPEQLVLRLSHPVQNVMDQNIVLTQAPEGFYSGELPAEATGRWHVYLEDQELTWRLWGDWQLADEAPLQLLPHQ
jgi:hypothetical protein